MSLPKFLRVDKPIEINKTVLLPSGKQAVSIGNKWYIHDDATFDRPTYYEAGEETVRMLSEAGIKK